MTVVGAECPVGNEKGPSKGREHSKNPIVLEVLGSYSVLSGQEGTMIK